MKIIVDAFGGDHAPLEPIKGAAKAQKELGVTVVLAGDSEKIKACAKENKIQLAGMEFLEAPAVFQMEYDPTTVLREHNNTSMAVGLKALAAKEGDAFVSAGSTGALLVGGTLMVKRVRGVRRAAIGAVLPGLTAPFLLLDAGANAECTPEMLENFALVGSVYAKSVLGLEQPRVALVNIGTEETKGDSLRQETFQRLSAAEGIHFIGNIEAREVPLGGCDVVVADGFTGNIMLKLYEGMGKMISQRLKKLFLNPFGVIGAVFVSGGLLKLKKQTDYKEYGGAPLLGLSGVVIKAHGSSDAKAIYHSIRQAKACVEGNMVDTIKASLKR